MTERIIVTTGDVSDYDGFLALLLYLKFAKNNNYKVVFIMNYPAYMGINESTIGGKLHKRKVNRIKKGGEGEQDKNKLYRLEEGKGYNYNAVQLFEEQKLNDASISYAGANQVDLTNPTNETYRILMRNLAYDMCINLVEECDFPKENFIFVDGGINEINPFSITSIKNEFNVYCPTIMNLTKGKAPFKLPTFSEWVETIGDSEIHMDMNGSMAFYETNEKFLQNLKSVFIMGGVTDEEPPTTLSTTPFLNRFSTATMNQLYATKKTNLFLQDLYNKNIVPYIVTNNEVNKKYAFTDVNGLKLAMKDLLNDDKPSSKLFTAYYERLDVPQKPFDVLTALALSESLSGGPIFKINDKNLFYSSEYGSTIVSLSNEQKKIIENMKAQLEKKSKSFDNSDAPSFIKEGILAEQSILIILKEGMQGIIIPVKECIFESTEYITEAITKITKPLLSSLSGGKKSKKYISTNEKVMIGNSKRIIYKGMRGAKYVKLNGAYVPIKKAVSITNKK